MRAVIPISFRDLFSLGIIRAFLFNQRPKRSHELRAELLLQTFLDHSLLLVGRRSHRLVHLCEANFSVPIRILVRSIWPARNALPTVSAECRRKRYCLVRPQVSYALVQPANRDPDCAPVR